MSEPSPLRVEPLEAERGPARLDRFLWRGAEPDGALLAAPSGERWLRRSVVVGGADASAGVRRRRVERWSLRSEAPTLIDVDRFDLGPSQFIEHTSRGPIVLPAQLSPGQEVTLDTSSGLGPATVRCSFVGTVRLTLGEREAVRRALLLEVRLGEQGRSQWMVEGVGEVLLQSADGVALRWLTGWRAGDGDEGDEDNEGDEGDEGDNDGRALFGDVPSPTLEPLSEALLRLCLGLSPRSELRWAVDAEDSAGGAIPPTIVEVKGARAPWLRLDLRPRDELGISLTWRPLPDGRDPRDVPEAAAALAELLLRFRRARPRRTGPRLAALGDALREASPGHALAGSFRTTRLKRLQVLQATYAAEGATLYRHAEGAGSERRATLRLGFRCNQKCHFCWQGRDWPEREGGAETAFRDLRQLAAEGIKRLTVTGGEPTIYKELPALLQEATGEHGMQVHMQTNAIRLGRSNYLQRLLDAGLGGLFVSLHAGDAHTSDGMTRAPGTFVGTVAGVKAALAADLPVRLNCVVEERNVGRLVEHARFIVREFVTPYPDGQLLGVSYSHPGRYNEEEAWQVAVVPLDEVQAPLLEACSVLDEARVPVDVLGSCGFPPCLFQSRPDLLRHLARDDFPAWDRDARRFVEACDSCAMKTHCFGLRREYLDRHGARGVTPFVSSPL